MSLRLSLPTTQSLRRGFYLALTSGAIGLVAFACVNDKRRDPSSHSLGTVVVPADPGPPPAAAASSVRPSLAGLFDAGPGARDLAWIGHYAFSWKSDAGRSTSYEVTLREEKGSLPAVVTVNGERIACQGRAATSEVFDLYFDRCEVPDAGACAGLLRGAVVLSLVKRGGELRASFGALAAPDRAVRDLPIDSRQPDAGGRK